MFNATTRSSFSQLDHELQELLLETPDGSPMRPRQREVLHFLLNGLAEKQIAQVLGVQQCTIHIYVKQIYAKFGVESRAELLADTYGAALLKMTKTLQPRQKRNGG